jgi:hypothetical protein
VAFVSPPLGEPPLVVRVNFGILAGREATPAEIADLARLLLTVVGKVSIVSEQHYEIGDGGEAVVHQVRIELDDPVEPELETQVVETAALWAKSCAAERHAEI